MKKKLLNNWALKLGSLLLAVMIWMAVISIMYPVEEKSFANIKVALKNTHLITDENKVYEVLDGTDVVRIVSVNAVREVLDKLTQGDIVAEADFANLTEDNTVEIKFYSNRFNESIQAIKGNIETVSLNIEAKKTKFLTLVPNTLGEPAEGYIIGGLNIDENRIEVSGPESIVGKISTAGISVDVTDSTNDIITYADVVLYDSQKNVIAPDSLVMNVRSVRVSAQVLATKEVPLNFHATGEAAQGYMATGVIEGSPGTVGIAGKEELLAEIHSIEVPEEALDITGRNMNLATQVNVNQYLPEGVRLIGDFGGRATVTVYIEKIETKDLNIPKANIRIWDLPSKFTAELIDLPEEYTIKVSGLQDALDSISSLNVYGNIRINDWMRSIEMAELVPGTYQVPVEFNFTQGITLMGKLRANMKIAETEE